MQPLLRHAEGTMGNLARHCLHGLQPRLAPAPELERGLRQAARELLLAQASDWPFLIRHGTAGDYPQRRFSEHLTAFHDLARMLSGVQPWDVSLISAREFRHPIFPNLDWRLWA
jgi:1,4-alpha-glucan branching enzyme